MNDDLPKLLRAMARGTQAKDNMHDVPSIKRGSFIEFILNAAADELDVWRGLDVGHGKGINPTRAGLYVAYVNDPQLTTVAARIFLMCHNGQWYRQLSDQRYRGTVYQWVGPLPVLRLED